METGIYCLKHVFNGRVHSEEIVQKCWVLVTDQCTPALPLGFFHTKNTLLSGPLRGCSALQALRGSREMAIDRGRKVHPMDRM